MRARIGHLIADANKAASVPASGTLAMNGWIDGGSYTGTLNRPVRLFPTIDGKHIYSTNGFGPGNGITAFARDTDSGALTRLDALAPIGTGYDPAYILESPDQKHIYCICQSSSYINHYNRDPATGKLTFFGSGTNANIGSSGNSSPKCGTISPDGAHVYTTAMVDNAVYCFSRDTNSVSGTFGRLSILAGQTSLAITGASQPMAIAMTRNASSGISGKYAYVGNFGGSNVCCLVRDNNPASPTYGQLSMNTAQTTQITTSISTPAWLRVSPDDRHLYVISDSGAGLITAYTIDQGNGSLTFLASYMYLNGAWSLAITSDGAHVYVAESDGVSITQYTRDNNPASPNFGKLTLKVPSKVRACPYFTWLSGSSLGPNCVVVAPGDKHLYATPAIGNYSVPTFLIHP